MKGTSIRLEAGGHTRQGVPIVLEMESGRVPEGPCVLEPGAIPAQVTGNRLMAVIPLMETGTSSRLEIIPGGGGGMTAIEKPGSLEFRESGKLVTGYLYKPECGYQYVSKPYFYPLNLDGLGLSRPVPKTGEPEPADLDHPHHRSLWVAFGDVNGAEIWNEPEGHGFQKHIRFEGIFQGPAAAGCQALLEWTTADGKRLATEKRSFTVWRSVDGGRFLDLSVRFEASTGPVRLGDTKEGGFCAVRLQDELRGDRTGVITNSNGGHGEKECWGHRSSWVDYSGTLTGKKVGIAILDHPDSFRFPTHWHVRDYGLFAANAFGLSHYGTGWLKDGSHSIPAGDHLTFKYRIFLHEGDCNASNVAERWIDFAYPPFVELAA